VSAIVKTHPQVPKKPGARSLQRRQVGKTLGPYLFLLPATLFLAVFLLYPVCTMLLFSFEQVNVGSLLTGDTPFVGLDNYHTVLTDPTFRSSIVVSLAFTLGCLVF
jgi:multiple sugar transport system permease protein